MKKFPSFSQWKQVFKVLKKGEKIRLLAFSVIALASLYFLTTNFYASNTVIAPALGGEYTEGIVGQPRFINPIYGETNDVDRTLIELVFSGLMSYDSEGKITTHLAKDYEISEDGKTYEFWLAPDAYWHDGKRLTADDIIFTIKTIQTPDYKSPLRANWIDVEVQKTSESSVKFILKTPYNSFLENATVKIIPKHIWENILPENFALSFYNLQPIGSGPFKFKSIDQNATGFVKRLELDSNRKYYKPASFISKVSFTFFEKKEDLVKSTNRQEIDGFTLASLENNQAEAQKAVKPGWGNSNAFDTYSFSMPRYFAVFFNNQKTSLFADKNIRKALSYAVDKNKIVENIYSKTESSALPVDSPILPEFFDYAPGQNIYNFDAVKAKELLDKTEFKENTDGIRQKNTTKKPAFQFKSYLKVGSKGSEVVELQACLAKLDENFKNIIASEVNGTYGKLTEEAVTEFQKKYLPDLKPTGETGQSTRAKLNQLCAPASESSQIMQFTLVSINQPQLLWVANELKQYWESVGAVVQIQAVSAFDIKTIIKERKYDALLYGEALGSLPDLYPFWHSSQKLDPGLNLSSYENKDADQLLKDAREALDETVKKQKLEKLQDVIVADAPALFLYNPDYIYWVSKEVQGIDTQKIIDPAKRFSNATQWFIKTKRTWK